MMEAAAAAAPAVRAFPGPAPPATRRYGFNLAYYSILSLAVTFLIVWKEWRAAQEQFYTAVVSLVHSKAAVLAFCNLAATIMFLLAKGIKSMFLGTLRDVETEHLTERLSGSVMDTLLAMTIFRAELSLSFGAQFALLIFVKSFHWLVQKRADYIGQTPVTSRTVYLRLATLQFMLLCVDVSMTWLTVSFLRKNGPNIQLLFAFEYGLLATSIVATSIKYALTLYDMLAWFGHWENKSVVFLYLDFVVDMVQIVVYLLFFVAVLINYGLPLHIIRQIHQTFASFQRRVGDLVRYRRATKHLETNFPDASAQEIESAHNVCCICREELQQNAKKLPNCGHVLHLRCLRGWLEHQQRCPICRTPVLFEDLEPEQQRQRILRQQQHQHQPPQPQPQPPSPPALPSTVFAPAQIIPPNNENRNSATAGAFAADSDSRAMSPTARRIALAQLASLQSAVSSLQHQIVAIQDSIDILSVYLAEQPPTGAPLAEDEEANAGHSEHIQNDTSSQEDIQLGTDAITHNMDPSTVDEQVPSSPDEVRRRRLLRFSDSGSPQ